jgi:fluoride exporter
MDRVLTDSDRRSIEIARETSLEAARNLRTATALAGRAGGEPLRRVAAGGPAHHDASVNVTFVSRVVWVGLGGMAGSVARYLLSGWIMKALGLTFPLGTFAVNVIGSLLLGVIMAIGVHTTSLNVNAQLGLTTGVMGGFTTYSTFNFETLRLLEERAWALAGLNVAVTLLGCLAAGWLGWQGTAWLLAGRAAR